MRVNIYANITSSPTHCPLPIAQQDIDWEQVGALTDQVAAVSSRASYPAVPTSATGAGQHQQHQQHVRRTGQQQFHASTMQQQTLSTRQPHLRSRSSFTSSALPTSDAARATFTMPANHSGAATHGGGDKSRSQRSSYRPGTLRVCSFFLFVHRRRWSAIAFERSMKIKALTQFMK
jgi:hypothetical protein